MRLQPRKVQVIHFHSNFSWPHIILTPFNRIWEKAGKYFLPKRGRRWHRSIFIPQEAILDNNQYVHQDGHPRSTGSKTCLCRPCHLSHRLATLATHWAGREWKRHKGEGIGEEGGGWTKRDFEGRLGFWQDEEQKEGMKDGGGVCVLGDQ